MATRVLLTIDTELAWRHQDAGLDWPELVERSFDPAGVGVPYQLARLAEHRLKACFFVDPMPALVHGIEPVRRMVAPIMAAGQEVQLHLHSFWHDLAMGRTARDARFDLTDFDAVGQAQLVATARALLIEAGAPMPTAFRSGSYAADGATLDALVAAGLSFDSSHNGGHAPHPSALPLAADLIDPARIGGLLEVPVTQVREPGGALRHLQLCALSSAEIEGALDHAARRAHPVTTLVSHSFELATRDGRRPNVAVRRRFDRLCAFLDAHRASMPTVGFADLADGPDLVPPHPSRPFALPGLLARRRRIEQLWVNARYERPATTLTAITGSSASGIEMLVPLVGL